MSEEALRCFVAVPVGNGVREELAQWRSRARRNLPNARWVKPENYHLTIKFFGEITHATLNSLISALDVALADCAPFEVEMVGLGAFPNLEHPRVLWAGVGQGREELRRLAGIVEAASLGLELPAERKDYHPHLTLSRFRVPARQRDLGPEIHEALERRWGSFAVQSVQIIRSRLTPQGSLYSLLHTFPLAGGEAGERTQDSSMRQV